MKEMVCPIKDEFDKLIYLSGNLLRNGLYKIGLYAGQPMILDVIDKNPGLTQKTLADMGGIKPSTINVMLARMSKNELVEIKKDKENSKLSKVYITEKGKKLCDEALNYKKSIQEKQYNGFSAEEIRVFKSMLNRMNKNLEAELNKEEDLNENN